ncbi:MAG: polysaccharide biosynthesis protein [Candidatus Improbicoccus pseudotrichonymphae]|uniref:Polysaccharide biosynthesis protein n=1 Tax=Candidatus Improbicoccus pseudotrichonymphae TaxID=3033792 RepID=A0AA48HV78_9FIRM|nr:MAG: polysaccharide biosynthesis protein [Candidatus Improbicoccus pseudotrichonymphae]
MLKIFEKIKNHKIFMLFLLDFIIWNISFYLSFAINKNSFSLIGFEGLFLECVLVVNVCFTVIFMTFKTYDRIWRYAEIEDFFYAGVSIIFSNFLFFIFTFLKNKNLGIRMYVLFLLISEFLNFMSRVIYRVNILLENSEKINKIHKKRLLIVGAGEVATMILREISRNPNNEYLPIYIVDDDRNKIGRSISGIKVKGSVYEIPQICANENIAIILFAIVNIKKNDKERILDICSKTSIEVRIVPNIYETLTKGNLISSIRHVKIEDLLGREPVIFDSKNYAKYIKNKNILVTGGGGSIGSELCRQIAGLNPKNLIILDIYENSAYEIQQELYRKYILNKRGDLKFEVQIASVRDIDKIDKVFLEKKIDVVFHAAAHKHVPLMEENPEEAVKNNVFGTLNVALISEKYKIDRFVLISTDKAVRPSSVMGATKRICEMIIQLMAQKTKNTKFTAVRFGNVLGSNGSVIPLFEQQIKEKGPVTITHPEITRYFMTISEAVSLVITAGSISKGGEIFVLDMGEPVKIKDLAENLIRLSGFVPNKDIEIKFVGLRPGEKLYEELLLDEEDISLTENKKIYIGNPIKFDTKKFELDLEVLKKTCNSNNHELIKKNISKIVPIVKNQT